jgi:hypothetical protein
VGRGIVQIKVFQRLLDLLEFARAFRKVFCHGHQTGPLDGVNNDVPRPKRVFLKKGGNVK